MLLVDCMSKHNTPLQHGSRKTGAPLALRCFCGCLGNPQNRFKGSLNPLTGVGSTPTTTINDSTTWVYNPRKFKAEKTWFIRWFIPVASFPTLEPRALEGRTGHLGAFPRHHSLPTNPHAGVFVPVARGHQAVQQKSHQSGAHCQMPRNLRGRNLS